MLGIADDFKLKDGLINDINSFKIFYSMNYIWIANYIKILEYSSEDVVLKIKNNVIKINGSNLTIKILEKKELVLYGNINSVVFDNPYGAHNV